MTTWGTSRAENWRTVRRLSISSQNELARRLISAAENSRNVVKGRKIGSDMETELLAAKPVYTAARPAYSETFMVAGLPLLRHKRERRSHGDRVFDGTGDRAVVGIIAVQPLGRLQVVGRRFCRVYLY